MSEGIYREYLKVVDRRLPVYVFLSDLKRNQVQSFNYIMGEPTIREKEFVFTHGSKKYMCHIVSSYSAREDANENNYEVTINDGKQEFKQKRDIQSILDDPIMILQFVSFLYNKESSISKKESFRRKLGIFFLRNYKKAKLPKFRGEVGRLINLFKLAIEQFDESSYHFFTKESEKLSSIAERKKAHGFREDLKVEHYEYPRLEDYCLLPDSQDIVEER